MQAWAEPWTELRIPLLFNLRRDPYGKMLTTKFHTSDDPRQILFKFMGDFEATGKNPITDPRIAETMWDRTITAANEAQQDGVFSAFVGYEWSAQPGGNNLHRVVIFRDGQNPKSVVPFSSYDSNDPEDLWKWLATYEEKTGGEVFAIPHNGNLSNGLMFGPKNFEGKEFDRGYAERRARWEPLIEVTQMKGDGETHPFLSADDEFADYENLDTVNLGGTAAKEQGMLAFEYARSTLKLGLSLEAKLSVNPYKFGMIGSSDSHTSLATTREENNFGKVPPMEPFAGNKDRFEDQITPALPGRPYIKGYQSTASGLVGVWAENNTRAEIFDAMERKEVYATTGTIAKTSRI